jgi:uncharacterized protein (TIGR02145 family)
LKAIGQGSGGGVGTNTSGFSALLAGKLRADGNFSYLHGWTEFISSTMYNATIASTFGLWGDEDFITIGPDYIIDEGLSIRCIKY